jgi:hypothetical protein
VQPHQHEQNDPNKCTETLLENKNPATPDQESRIDKIATIMAASAASFSTE